jgi:hypothetical protein
VSIVATNSFIDAIPAFEFSGTSHSGSLTHGLTISSFSPPVNTDTSIVHNAKKVYATIYQIGIKLPKHHKLGIHSTIEQAVLGAMTTIISASFSPKTKKFELLEKVRVALEITKHLVRTEYELKIITQRQYIQVEAMLVEISKMTNGWIKYVAQNPTK